MLPDFEALEAMLKLRAEAEVEAYKALTAWVDSVPYVRKMLGEVTKPEAVVYRIQTKARQQAQEAQDKAQAQTKKKRLRRTR